MATPEGANGIPIPPGLDALLDEMSCQILHNQPPNILSFLADYLEAKLRKRNGELGPNETTGKHAGDSVKDGMQGDKDGKDFNRKDPYDQDTKNRTSGSENDQDSRLSETPSQKAQRERNGENGQNGQGQGQSRGSENDKDSRLSETPSQRAQRERNSGSGQDSQGQGQGQPSDKIGKKRNGDSLSDRIYQLSAVLGDALDKGQQLGKFHGVKGPDGESDGGKDDPNGGEDEDGGRREGVTVMRGNDKVTYRGSVAGLVQGGENVGGGNLDGGGGPGQPGNGQPGGQMGAPHGDQNRLNSLSTRIEELSVVLADALGKGQMLSDFHKTTFAEQAEAAREAQAQLKLEAEQEWEKTNEMRERQETQKLARQAEYMQMLIAQIEDMSHAVELALSLLGPMDTNDVPGLRKAKKSRSSVTFSADVEEAEARKQSGELSNYSGDNRKTSDGVEQAGRISRPRRSSDEALEAARYAMQIEYLELTTEPEHSDNSAGTYERLPTTSTRNPSGDRDQPNLNDQDAAVRRIDNNTPRQWRRVDLSGVGETLRQFFQDIFGQHIDTMKRVFWGETPMSDAPVHSVILAISLGILVAIGLSLIRSLWRALY